VFGYVHATGYNVDVDLSAARQHSRVAAAKMVKTNETGLQLDGNSSITKVLACNIKDSQ